MISSLQALRFIFALFIFAQHFLLLGEKVRFLLPGAGPMGVSFFLVLSGFVMSIGYAERVKESNFNWWGFMKKRLIRVWPLHILCLAVWLLATSVNGTLETRAPLPILGNLFMLQGWIPMVEAKGNDVSWCLSTLIFFYALFPSISRLRTKWLIGGLVIYGALIALFGSQLPLVDHRGFTLRYWFFYFSTAARLIDCVVGMLAYRLLLYVEEHRLLSWWQKQDLVKRLLMESLPVILFIVAFQFVRRYDVAGNHAYPYLIPSMTIICVFAIAQKSGEKNGIPAYLCRSWLIYLGEISFSFYMIHHLVIRIMNMTFSWIYPELYWVPRLVITLGVSIIGSIIINRYFEQPITRLLSRRD
nr:acyltransferase [uncultured Porphyromonas sp.]